MGDGEVLADPRTQGLGDAYLSKFSDFMLAFLAVYLLLFFGLASMIVGTMPVGPEQATTAAPGSQ
jgi:hypothetical protein